jgi:hypothetical protein
VAQTVPDCQNLYKNTFLYHSASAVPDAPKHVPLDECVAFIGAQNTATGRASIWRAAGARHPARGLADALRRLHRGPFGFDARAQRHHSLRRSQCWCTA